jgi:hypothetical protein
MTAESAIQIVIRFQNKAQMTRAFSAGRFGLLDLGRCPRLAVTLRLWR